MHHIFVIMGKSATGKDTIYRRLLEEESLSLSRVVPYTTRPVRDGEQNGREYFFTDGEGYESACREGRVIESRAYDTVYGRWYYFTLDDGQIDLTERDSLVIGTLVSFRSFVTYFGRANVIPVYIEVEDGERLSRALQRERRQDHPGYAEMCRRFLADSADFSEENLRKAGITGGFRNDDIDCCVARICQYIREAG